MAFCKKCGTKLDDDSKFCHECGTPRGNTAKSQKKDSDLKYQTRLKQDKSYGSINLSNLPKNHEINNRYKIIKKIGQGGFGAVYEVKDNKLGTKKALKVLPETIASDRESMELLKNEASTMAKLNHPNIVRVYDFEDKGTIKYIDMEFVDGKNLTDIKLDSPEKRLNESEVKKYAVQIAKGLAYAHSKGVIHKDIKPQNILVSKENEIKIMDFGISETVRTSMSRLDNTGTSGTLVYMSPEQLTGKNVGKESDIYSFGALLYELLSGTPPFNKGDITWQKLNSEPEKINGISEKLNHIINKCLKKDFRQRYKNFGEVVNDFEKKILKGRLTVKTIPSDAIVEIMKIDLTYHDGIELENGRYEIQVSKSGYKTRKGYFEIKNGNHLVINAKLEKAEPDVSTPDFTNYLGMKFVYIPPGTFMMGSPSSESGRENDEKQHKVTLTKGYFMQTTEVTQAQWKKVMGNNPSYFKNCGDNCPVEYISWNDAKEFIKKLNNKDKNFTYRLPTEAEWEYAARAGTTTPFYFGNCLSTNEANYDGNYPLSGCSKGQYRKTTIPVKSFSPNKFGLYDMHGNVWEWCEDCYGDYPSGHVTNPPVPGAGSSRVIRGGSWGNVASYCRSANRDHYSPDYRFFSIGFRLVASQAGN